MRDVVIVAANWKMHTTPADAGELAATIAARTREPTASSGSSARRSSASPPCATRWPSPIRMSPSVPRTSTTSSPAPTRARSSAPMLAGLATWVIVGHSERRRDAAETDALIGRKLGRAVDAGLRPILCVGEQLADREAGRATTVVDAQLRGALEDHDADRADRGRAGHRLRARLGDRHRPERDRAPTPRRWPMRSGRASTALGWADGAAERPGPLRRQRHQRHHRRVPGRAGDRWRARRRRLAQARRDGRHRRPSRHDRAARGSRRRARPPGDGRTAARPRPIVLVVLDGFGIGRDPAGRRHRGRADADLARPAGALAARRAAGIRGRGRAAAGPDGQLGGRPPESRRGPAGAPGPAAHRRRHRRRLVLRPAGPHRRVRPGDRKRDAAAPRQPDRAGRGACQRSASRSALAELAARQRCPGRPSPRAARRPGHATVVGPRVHRGRSRRGWRRSIPDARDRDRRRPLLRDGSRPSLGSGRARLRRDRPRPRPPTRADRRCRHRGGATRGARPTSSWRPPSSTAPPAPLEPGDVDRPRQLPGRPGPPADPRAGRRPRLRWLRPDLTARPAGAGRPARRDDDRIRGGPAGRGRLPARDRALARPGHERGRLDAVPCRRDREVRARDLLLQRRRRGGLAGRGPTARPEPEASRPTTCSRRCPRPA